MTEEPGFYCNMNALSKTERQRHGQLIRELGAARMETQELPQGYAFRLQREKVSLADLSEWISYEARCCPFFDFEVELQRDNGPLWLKLKGKDGIKPFIRAELGMT